MPVQGLRRIGAAALVEVASRRRPPHLRAEPAQLLEELLLGRETAWHQAGCALGRVPGAEVLDRRLRMDVRLWVGGELLHRRRAAKAACRRAQLVEDLLVGVALAE